MRIISLFLFVMVAIAALPAGAAESNEAALRKHVLKLSQTKGYRNAKDTAMLNRAAQYIFEQLSAVTTEVYTQEFLVNGSVYQNIYASFGPVNAPRIIVGAHYDVCGAQAGADDNASGVAGLLELARLLAATDKSKWEMRVDLVAYSLEEPPHFGTENMGSSVHATTLHTNKVPVVGMICLEMIGYYDDTKNSQEYPIGLLKMFYGNRGDFITIVRKMGNGRFPREFTRKFKKGSGVETKVFKAFASITGVDLSDHRNYWQRGYSALMITDTAFYRNKNYHTEKDTPETLDYLRMSSVVDRLYHAITGMM